MNKSLKTIKTLLAKAAQQFDWGTTTIYEQRLLLQALLQYSHAKLMSRIDEPVDEVIVHTFWQHCERCQAGEPLAYVLGHQPFHQLELHVTPAVLIPRSDTEVLVETVLQTIHNKTQTVLDLGTGSGAIALALLHARPSWQVMAMDASWEALKIAYINSQQLNLTVPLFQGCWTEAIASHSIDILVANPPYLSETDPHLFDKSLQAEPKTALVAKADGLAAFMAIIHDAKRVLRSQGHVFLEHGWQQHHVVADLLRDAGAVSVELVYDYQGHPRVTWAIL